MVDTITHSVRQAGQSDWTDTVYINSKSLFYINEMSVEILQPPNRTQDNHPVTWVRDLFQGNPLLHRCRRREHRRRWTTFSSLCFLKHPTF